MPQPLLTVLTVFVCIWSYISGCLFHSHISLRDVICIVDKSCHIRWCCSGAQILSESRLPKTCTCSGLQVEIGDLLLTTLLLLFNHMQML